MLAETLGIMSTKRLTLNGNFSVTYFKYFDMKKLNSVRKFWIRIAAGRNFLERPKGNSNERSGRQKVSVKLSYMSILLIYEYAISILTKWKYIISLPLLPNYSIAKKCRTMIQKLSARAWFFKNFLATRLPGCRTFSTSGKEGEGVELYNII